MTDKVDFDISQIEKDLQNIKLDFGTIYKEKYVEVDVCGLIKKTKQKKRSFFNINAEVKQLAFLISKSPCKNECYKIISVSGGFSSLAIIKYVAETEKIEELYVSTFRIGKKHFDVLCDLKNKKMIGSAFFITSQSQQEIDSKRKYKDKEYNYYEYVLKKCKDFNWKLNHFENHSKLILMKTNQNYYIVETSSNLNENPKMEQFNWENDKNTFEWYKKLFKELLK